MAEKKISRKELLKEPDEFLTTTGQIIRFVKEHPRQAKIGVTAVAALVLAVAGFFYYNYQMQIRSHELFEKAYRDYETTLVSPKDPTPQKLENLFAQFDAIANDYSSYVPGETALLYSGHILYQKKDFKGALERYNRMQTTSLVKGGLEPLVMYHVATTRFALNEYEPALVLFDQLSKDTNSPYRREAHASVARIYEAMGKNKEAVQAYRQYLKMFPEAPDAPFVRARIADLAAQG